MSKHVFWPDGKPQDRAQYGPWIRVPGALYRGDDGGFYELESRWVGAYVGRRKLSFEGVSYGWRLYDCRTETRSVPVDSRLVREARGVNGTFYYRTMTGDV